MPIYCYVEENTGKSVEVLRNFSEYDIGPTLEEAVKAGLTEEEVAVAVYKKVLGTGIKMTRGPNWGGSKGNWGRGY